MVEQITVKDLEQYYDGRKIDRLPKSHIYEAMCEQIVALNPDYEIQNLASEYDNMENIDAEEFAKMKIESVLSDEIKDVITIKQYQTWIQSVLQGFRDYGVLH